MSSVERSLLRSLIRRFVRVRVPRKSWYIICVFVCVAMVTWNSNQKQVLDSSVVRMIDLDAIKLQQDQSCVHPSLPVWSDQLRSLYDNNRPVPLGCLESEKNWVEAANGRISILKPGAKCELAPIIRVDDYTVEKGKSINVKDGDVLAPTDAFYIDCVGPDGSRYDNAHIGIPRDENIVRRSEDFRKLKSQVKMPPNILIFGFDSVSRLGWQRLLPKSHLYFANELGGIVLEGYNIVGDGTTPSLLGLLTGKMEEELPESRKGFEGAKTVDDYPWIWNDLKKLGYVTQYGEDMVQYSTFTLRLLGFQNQSTDYSYRPFGLAQDKYRGKYRYCLKGNQPQHLSQINWMRDFVRVYRDRPKFSFVFNSELTHDSTFQLPLADDDLLNLLQDFQKEGHLDNTLLILMSDHGPRFSTHRETERGRLEERNPYIGIRFPPDFLRQNPDIFENIKTNVHRLTTPFDLFATLRDFANLTMDYAKPDLQASMKREMSILRRIPKERTCADAGILPHWCACLDWVKVPENDDLVRRAARTVVSFINNMTAGARSQCAELTLKSIESAVRFRQNDHVFKFQKSLDYHGREPDLSGTKKSTKSLYLVQISTSPNEAIYEVTIDHLLLSDRFELDGKAVSRINKYGQQPHCIIDSHPHLRQFCYCVEQPAKAPH